MSHRRSRYTPFLLVAASACGSEFTATTAGSDSGGSTDGNGEDTALPRFDELPLWLRADVG
jgi:hypothetical protein